MYVLSLLERNKTKGPISSGFANLPNGIIFFKFVISFFVRIFFVKYVFTNPGDTEFINILCLANSIEDETVNPFRPNFDIEYEILFSLLFFPQTEEIFIILPYFFFFHNF